MPSLRDPALDERFDELAAQIRGARPRASEALRLRVAESATRSVPVAEPRRRRRLVPILAFAAVLLIGAVVAFAAGSLDGSSRADEQSAAAETAAELRQYAPVEGSGRAADSSAPESAQPPGALAPSPTRLQLYRAQMTIRVDSIAELNAATRRAIRIARSLGGFVVSADLRTPEQGVGTSRLVLRVPTTRAQTAFERLAGIGTLVAQRVRLDDLQAGVNRRNERIDDLQAQIAQLERRAARGEDVDDALAVLRAQLRQEREAVEAATRRGRLATFTLALTTADAAAAAEPDGDIEHAARQALDLLDDVVAVALYGLILGGPLVLLAAVIWLLERRRRRRSDEHLLEQN
jgi:hypothetical protein